MACDGTRYREDKVQVESALANPAGFKASLFEQFQIDVNAAGTKQCQAYDLDGVWWAACQTM